MPIGFEISSSACAIDDASWTDCDVTAGKGRRLDGAMLQLDGVFVIDCFSVVFIWFVFVT